MKKEGRDIDEEVCAVSSLVHLTNDDAANIQLNPKAICRSSSLSGR
jgi:hypothetical protein